MNRTDISKLGGSATSTKKARAARRNARLPRPGRTAFNRAVRDVLAHATGQLTDAPRGYLLDGIALKYGVDLERAGKILDAALRRQGK